MLDKMISIDTNVAIFLCDATDGNYDPTTDTELCNRPERLAIFRIFLYIMFLRITPTAKSEIKKQEQSKFCMYNLQDLPSHNINYGEVNRLMAEFKDYSCGFNDRKILAEAIAGGCDCILSWDKRLLSLKDKVKIEIIYPSAFWDKYAPRKGSKAVIKPDWSNPKVTQDWYLW